MSKNRPSPGYRAVAQRAGVSLATVSRVASGLGGVTPELAIRVREAAASLGASLESHGRGPVLAFLLCNRDLLHPIHSRIFVGAESYCRAQGWEVVFQGFQYPKDAPARELRLPYLLERRGVVRAAILAGMNSASLLDSLDGRGIGYAVLGNNLVGPWDPAAHDVVYMDDIEGAREMTRYLLALGHRDIWFIGHAEQPWSERAAGGYREVMEAAGLPVRCSTLHSAERQVGYLATKSLLMRREPVTAIFASSDPTAEGVLRALRDSGVCVPDDISVAGINDTEGAILHPPLTTIRSFPEEVGRHLAELVLSRIDNPDQPRRQLVIPTELIRRESCRPPAAPSENPYSGGPR